MHSFSPLHFASDYEDDIHIARNLGEGFGFPQRVRANLIWVSWGQGIPADICVTETIRVVSCLKDILSIAHHTIILSLNESRPQKAERRDPLVPPASRIISTEVSLNIRTALKEAIRNKR